MPLTNIVRFVSGIDTGIGKSYATAYYAKYLKQKGLNVITQKPVQTGCVNSSEDLALHDVFLANSNTMDGKALQYRCSYLFSYPASPHLAARMENQTIEPSRIINDTRTLVQLGYNAILMEGAGGLMVPLNDDLLTIDFIAKNEFPLVFVTSGKLGSINHTLLSLEAIEQRSIPLEAVIYNNYPGDTPEIETETKRYIKAYLEQHHPNCTWLELPILEPPI